MKSADCLILGGSNANLVYRQTFKFVFFQFERVGELEVGRRWFRLGMDGILKFNQFMIFDLSCGEIGEF